ncbi:MAG: ABC transporter ATP-binding protein [Chloroflexi bacterium]|nr:ABC transporter ATP-binding protein [Chloroflexota bacterium]
MSTSVIEVDGLVKVYKGGTRALDGARLSVAHGERVCLLGPNGAGKSTLIKILAGVLAPTEGDAEVLGMKTNAPNFKETKRRVGIVPEGPGVYEDLTVKEYLELVSKLYRRGSVDKVMEMFDLGQYAGATMNKLSGGFQRRVVLAAAFLPDPELLLLDEPTVRLDPIAALQIHNYIFAGILFELLAGLAFSTATAMVLGVLAKDYRTANNMTGFLMGPMIPVTMGIILFGPFGPWRLFIEGGLLLLLAYAVTHAVLKRVTLERMAL